MEGTIPQDSGAEIRDGIKSVAQLGAPPETLWPYDPGRFARKPTRKVYREAVKHQAIRYARVAQDGIAIQTVLADGYPISFGFTVYESFETKVGADGIVPLPQPSERTLGGHAVVLVGYKQIQGQLYFECRNSWGDRWADAGYFWMPARVRDGTEPRERLLGDQAGRVARAPKHAAPPTATLARYRAARLPRVARGRTEGAAGQ